MFRVRPWPCFLVWTLACSLSVDDPVTERERTPPPVGNPLAGGPARSSWGGGGRAATVTDQAAGGQGSAGRAGDSASAVEPTGGRLIPLDLPAADAAPGQCGDDAGACADVLCLSSDDCHAGLCVNSRCRSYCAADGDCAEGQACALGLCRTSPSETWECFVLGDCSPGEDCVSGGCLRRCSNDAHCTDSDDGEHCSMGYCGP
jgi:hypothetical protein